MIYSGLSTSTHWNGLFKCNLGKIIYIRLYQNVTETHSQKTISLKYIQDLKYNRDTWHTLPYSLFYSELQYFSGGRRLKVHSAPGCTSFWDDHVWGIYKTFRTGLVSVTFCCWTLIHLGLSNSSWRWSCFWKLYPHSFYIDLLRAERSLCCSFVADHPNSLYLWSTRTMTY